MRRSVLPNVLHHDYEHVAQALCNRMKKQGGTGMYDCYVLDDGQVWLRPSLTTYAPHFDQRFCIGRYKRDVSVNVVEDDLIERLKELRL